MILKRAVSLSNNNRPHISMCSFSKVVISFTHVIKSSEPVFSVFFSSFLGNSYTLQVWLSILPIVLSCSLAAIDEVSFNFQGMWGALISNLGFVLRNIYSKCSLQNFKEVDGLNLLFDEVEGFGLWFWTEDHLRKMIDEFEQIKQQLAECLGIP